MLDMFRLHSTSKQKYINFSFQSFFDKINYSNKKKFVIIFTEMLLEYEKKINNYRIIIYRKKMVDGQILQ